MKPQHLAALWIAAAASALAATPLHTPQWQHGRLVSGGGMTLYTFDRDAPHASVCNLNCLQTWPALTVERGEPVPAPFSLFRRVDGALQVALNGRPLYLHAADREPGDTRGDDSNGAWHAVRAGASRVSPETPPEQLLDYTFGY